MRTERVVDPYRRISLKNMPLTVNHVSPGNAVEIRVYHLENGMSELRFWEKDCLADIKQVKTADLQGVQF